MNWWVLQDCKANFVMFGVKLRLTARFRCDVELSLWRSHPSLFAMGKYFNPMRLLVL